MEVTTVAPMAVREVRPTPIVPVASFRTGVAAIIVVTVVWRYWTMSDWSWFQDDWVYMTKAAELPFWEYLSQNYNGHIMPGQFAIAWAMAEVAPLNYSYAVLVILGFIALSILIWAAALRTIFGERGRLLYMLVVLAISPLFMPISLWSAAAIQVFPLQLFMGLAVLFTARYMLEGRQRADLIGLTASYVAGLLFWEKALLIAVPVAFVAALLSSGSLRDRAANSKWVLGVIAGATVVYLPAYVLLTRHGDAAGPSCSRSETWVRRSRLSSPASSMWGFPRSWAAWSTPEDPQQLFAASFGSHDPGVPLASRRGSCSRHSNAQVGLPDDRHGSVVCGRRMGSAVHQ